MVFLEHYWDWDDDELVSLISKEKETHLDQSVLNSDESLMVAMRESIKFISRLLFQREKPWMSQLVVVACLSLVAKVEVTQVPLLLPPSIMELLLLYTLQWKMNPMTPLSFVDQIVRRFGFKTDLHLEFLFGCYLPSILAVTTMLHVIMEFESSNVLDCQNELMDVIKMSKFKSLRFEILKVTVTLMVNHHHHLHHALLPLTQDHIHYHNLLASVTQLDLVCTLTPSLTSRNLFFDDDMKLTPLFHLVTSKSLSASSTLTAFSYISMTCLRLVRAAM
ncbi:Cyclin-D3-1 [Camellia lanceoleosa]|uniref:Cyclin-D3-1 n=1 Tax=Camellia lanceoleosa TaxID=1840588 RepID=A0ACC0HDC3_9ERIC|nr:Cyclin-D3-1 [Camellia lanceoleosa]